MFPVDQYGYGAVALAVGVESTGVPFPGETTLVAAAIYAGSTHQMSIVLVIAAAAIGAVIGDNLGFWVGRELGHRYLLRYGRYIRATEPRIKLGQYLFLRHGGKVVFFGRFLAVLRALAAFLAGTNRMTWPRFLFFNVAGGLVWATVYGTGAYYLGQEIRMVLGPAGIALLAVATVTMVWGLVVLRRHERRLEEEAERALPGPLTPAKHRHDMRKAFWSPHSGQPRNGLEALLNRCPGSPFAPISPRTAPLAGLGAQLGSARRPLPFETWPFGYSTPERGCPGRPAEECEVSSKDLRIGVISDVRSDRNGVGTYYADLVEHLRDQVQQIEIFCPSCCPSRIAVPMPGDATQRVSFPEVRTLSERLATLNPHVLIIPTPGPWGMFGACYARRHRLPVIVGFHTQFKALADLYWRGFRGHTSGFLLRLAHRWLFRRCAVVLVTAPAMMEEARALGAPVVDVMGTPLSQRFIGRPLRPLAPKITTVLFAGRLAPEKNLESVVDAARRLPRLQFKIAGDGPMRARIAELAQTLPNLELLGWLPRAKVLDLLDTVDLLVLPSHEESFGTIALEGLARGRNVLISTNCGIAEWPMFEHAPFRIEKDESLAQAIRRLADSDSAVRRDKARLGTDGATQMSQWAIDNWLATLANYAARDHA